MLHETVQETWLTGLHQLLHKTEQETWLTGLCLQLYEKEQETWLTVTASQCKDFTDYQCCVHEHFNNSC